MDTAGGLETSWSRGCTVPAVSETIWGWGLWRGPQKYLSLTFLRRLFRDLPSEVEEQGEGCPKYSWATYFGVRAKKYLLCAPTWSNLLFALFLSLLIPQTRLLGNKRKERPITKQAAKRVQGLGLVGFVGFMAYRVYRAYRVYEGL